MHTITALIQDALGPTVFVFTVSNLGMMGLQIEIGKVLPLFRSKRLLFSVGLWGFVVGPLLALLITRIIPLAPPYALVLLLTSLAPSAPFLPLVVGRAGGDALFAGAFIPLATVGTVIFMPLGAPLLIEGTIISPLALARPLLLTVLLPLVLGTVLRRYASTFASKSFPVVKRLAGISSLVTVVFCLVMYGKAILGTTGSFALLAMTLFMVGMGLASYRFGFGLKQEERSVMALGMGTRNIAAVFAGVLAIPNPDPRILTMVVMWTLWSVLLAFGAAALLGKRNVTRIEK